MYIRRGECEYHYLQLTCFDAMSDTESVSSCTVLRCVCTSPIPLPKYAPSYKPSTQRPLLARLYKHISSPPFLFLYHATIPLLHRKDPLPPCKR